MVLADNSLVKNAHLLQAEVSNINTGIFLPCSTTLSTMYQSMEAMLTYLQGTTTTWNTYEQHSRSVDIYVLVFCSTLFVLISVVPTCTSVSYVNVICCQYVVKTDFLECSWKYLILGWFAATVRLLDKLLVIPKT